MNLLLPRDIVEAVLNDKKTKMHEWLSVMEVNFSRTASMNADFPAGKIILKLEIPVFTTKGQKSRGSLWP